MIDRFLSIKDFQLYAGNIGRNKAYELAKQSKARIKFGGRVVVDRDAFDRWAERQRECED